MAKWERLGLSRGSNPGPLAPKTRIIPLDHWATEYYTLSDHYKITHKIFLVSISLFALAIAIITSNLHVLKSRHLQYNQTIILTATISALSLQYFLHFYSRWHTLYYLLIRIHILMRIAIANLSSLSRIFYRVQYASLWGNFSSSSRPSHSWTKKWNGSQGSQKTFKLAKRQSM